MRLRGYDIRTSDFPSIIGLCQGDSFRVYQELNACQERLLHAPEAGDESWWGTWAEIAFNVSQTAPYITMPREIARIEQAAVCNHPVPIQNQFYEYLQFGNGRLPKTCCNLGNYFPTEGYTRNNSVLFEPFTNPPQLLTAFAMDPTDNGSASRILFQGIDETGEPVHTLDGADQVPGVYLPFEAPFVTTPFAFNALTGIQKDITNGPIQIFQTDPVTGIQKLLLTMQPTEQTAWYRRYYFNKLPCTCCNPVPGQTPQPVQVHAIAKLDLIPVVVDEDYCLIQSKEALICEAQSRQASKVMTPESQARSVKHHRDAIRLLNGQLTHYLGLNTPAVQVKPFGSASLARQRIGVMI